MYDWMEAFRLRQIEVLEAYYQNYFVTFVVKFLKMLKVRDSEIATLRNQSGIQI